MSDDKTNAEKRESEREAEENAAAIKEVDNSNDRPRGNIHSKPEKGDPEIEAPPPMPN